MADFSNPSVVVDFVLTLVLMGAGDTILFFLLKRTFVIVYTAVLEVLYILALIFNLQNFSMALVAAFIVGVSAFLLTNISDYRPWVSNAMKGKGNLSLLKRTSKVKPEAIFDREEMYQKVEAAVMTLSRQKIGALITFERKDDLSEVMKNGTMLNAPVSSELLQTIFYPGTRLHDGAVIIRNDKIAAASVYFTPTNRPLTGKFGSRHRAAYGISETTDSVTIVVSEETGRISIGFQGELTPVNPDNFLRIFEDDMASETPATSAANNEENKPHA
jgi:diadenylate cyclase